MSIEAMRQALDALEMYMCLDTPEEANMLETDIAPKAIVALKLAIEQADKQEPVMWVYRYTREDGSTYLSHVLVDERSPVEVPLYVMPPKPEWVGLTDDEIMKMYCEPRSDREMLEFAREFEAKLKEKNHG